jgi:hypothetical protein
VRSLNKNQKKITMLKQIVSLTIGLLLLVFISCTPKGDDKSSHPVLSKSIEYDVTINNFKFISMCGIAESNYNWYRNNLEGSVRSAYLELLFKNALAGKLELYDMNDKLIDTNRLKVLLLASVDSITAQRTEPPYDMYDTVINKTIQPEEITALRFREEWTYDPSTMAITKKVLAIAPVWTPINMDDKGNETYGKNKALFWVKWSKDPTNTKVLTKRIVSTINYLGTDSWEKATHVDSVAIQKYMKLFLDKVYKDSIAAYDISSGDLADILLNGKDLYKRLNSTDAIKQQRTEPPYDTYDTIIKRTANVTAIRFMEEWSFDPVTMAIEKKVVGICPVELCYDMNKEFKGYKPYFWVYFTDVWKPFDGKLELQKKKQK